MCYGTLNFLVFFFFLLYLCYTVSSAYLPPFVTCPTFPKIGAHSILSPRILAFSVPAILLVNWSWLCWIWIFTFLLTVNLKLVIFSVLLLCLKCGWYYTHSMLFCVVLLQNVWQDSNLGASYFVNYIIILFLTIEVLLNIKELL